MCIAKFRLVGIHRCTFTRADRNLTLVFFFSKKLLFSFPFFLYLLFGCQIPPDSGTQVPGQFLEQSFQAPCPTLVQDSLVHFSCFFFLWAGSDQMVEEESLKKFRGTKLPKPKAQETTGTWKRGNCMRMSDVPANPLWEIRIILTKTTIAGTCRKLSNPINF